MSKLKEFIAKNTDHESGWNSLPDSATAECTHWLSSFVREVMERATIVDISESWKEFTPEEAERLCMAFIQINKELLEDPKP